MREPLVTVQIVVRNGARYLARCLASVNAQSYPNYEVVILDNASEDATRDIAAQVCPQARLIAHPVNLGMWSGHEFLLPSARGTYVLCLSADVILHPAFMASSVAACEADPGIAAVQGKLYQYDTAALESDGGELAMHLIDTCGFALSRGRRVINIGHGLPDGPAYQEPRDVLGVEGAAPFYRRAALEQCRVHGHLWDPDFFWYGDDLDFAWRMTLFGLRQRFIPSAVAWHDRSTTKGAARVPVVGQLARLRARRAIPLHKRRLDWSNVRFAIIKNDRILDLLRDAPAIIAREVAVLGYTVLFEPRVLTELVRFARLLPRMLARRRSVMSRAVASPSSVRRHFL